MSASLRPVWALAAAAIAVAAVAAIATVVRGEPNEDDFKTVYSLVGISFCGGAAVGALHLLERPRLRLLGALVVVAAAVDFVLLEVGIWNAVMFDGESSDYTKLIPTGIAWGIALVVVATLPLLAVRTAVLATVVPATGVCAIVGATVATVMVWRDLESTGWAKTLAVLAILMIAGYLVTPLLARLARARQTHA